MKLICAWCRKEGKPALMADKEPLDDSSESHGLCPDHRKQVEEELIRFKAEAERRRTEAEQNSTETEALREKVDP